MTLSLYKDDNCPGCNADLRSSEIPPQSQRAYDGRTHFHRTVLRYEGGDDQYVKFVGYECPDCKHKWEAK